MHNRLAAGALAACLALPSSALAQAASRTAPTPAAGQSAARQADEYQVAAGSALLLKLRTPLHSASSVVDEQVEGTLWSPVLQNGVELIPEGSILFGKVVEVLPAGKRRPFGSVVVTFSIVEHANTGSRATVRTQRIVFSAEQAGGERRSGRPRPIDAVIPAGFSFSAMTAEPLRVRIPK